MNLIKMAIVLGALVCFSGCALVTTPAQSDGKVAVCHKGKKTIYVDESAVDAHLGHGDHVGVCR
jgi:hypothetical protein